MKPDVTVKSVRTAADVLTLLVRTQIMASVHHAEMVHVASIAARTADVVIPIVMKPGNAIIVKDAMTTASVARKMTAMA